MKSTRIAVPTDKTWEMKYWDPKFWAQEAMESGIRFMQGKSAEVDIRKEVENYVNIFWPILALWSGMLWDPKRFPMKTYELNKKGMAKNIKEMISQFPRRQRFLLNLSIPKNFSKVKDMKKMLLSIAQGRTSSEQESSLFFATGSGIVKFLEENSKTDAHYFRVYEFFECWGFKNVGVPMASLLPASVAGLCQGLEKEDRNWNAVETKCIGLGDPFCEFKLVPGEIDELSSSLQKDFSIVETINKRLLQGLNGFLLYGSPLVNRPRLGSKMHLQGASSVMSTPAMGGERYRIAWRMGGAKIGKRVGEHLMDAGVGNDEAVKRILHLLKYCQVGKVFMDETIRMKENCESIWTKFYTTTWDEPCCFFTTGFLNGFFAVVKGQHVKETRCIAMGDPYCEWEFQ
jgi:predicted hydrocarbon binding protein